MVVYWLTVVEYVLPELAGGSYFVSGPPDLDIRDISFKLRYITGVSQDLMTDLDILHWFCWEDI
jgi:hypothetical protein